MIADSEINAINNYLNNYNDYRPGKNCMVGLIHNM
jgi:hypothetical protein